MKVLIACEYSGVVRDAFLEKGHEAISCDLLPTESDGPHYQGDVMDLLDYPWDLIIAHPPCTDLCVSGARHFEKKKMDGRQYASVSFFMQFAKNNASKIAIENPVSIMSTLYRKPDQVIQPWQFGHGETKATCLWLKNLPLLKPTNIVEGRENRIHRLPRQKTGQKSEAQPIQALHRLWLNSGVKLTPYNFVKQFNAVCNRHGLNPVNVWHYCDMDEHQVLIDEQPGEWEDLEQCLKLWANRIMKWDRRHDVPLPQIHCYTCQWFDYDACGWFKKAIPEEFDKSNACKHWNEEK